MKIGSAEWAFLAFQLLLTGTLRRMALRKDTALVLTGSQPPGWERDDTTFWAFVPFDSAPLHEPSDRRNLR
ncbi:hypothetical protein [Nostoc sp. KVJ20]|uniref:hypothetical protein n=1 Tax=Nostoc sp. KVJ20 TaxID=457944 RepID=UPI00114CB405|nr:hypothetical protein [Nostoc sp. KVJ20]